MFELGTSDFVIKSEDENEVEKYLTQRSEINSPKAKKKKPAAKKKKPKKKPAAKAAKKKKAPP